MSKATSRTASVDQDGENGEKVARRTPGPVPGPEMNQYTILMEPHLGEWGKKQPGGLSKLLRQLLEDEYKKKTGS